VVSYLRGVYRVSQGRACRVARISVSTFRYQSTQQPRTALRLRIREIAQARIRYGYRKIRVLLKREGWNVGKKLVYRLYREEGLTLSYKPRRRRCAATNRRERCKPNVPNQAWSLDFVADQLADGRRFRALTVVDVFTRESLAIEPGQSLKGTDVVHVLNRICLQRTTPTLFCDNGSEFTSQAMDLWAYHFFVGFFRKFLRRLPF
jgi:putative transposase